MSRAIRATELKEILGKIISMYGDLDVYVPFDGYCHHNRTKVGKI